MVDVIRTWISDEEMAAKAVRELLRREVDTWQRLKLLIAPEALRLIDEQREALRKLSATELELIFRSTLKEGYEVSYWFERARLAGVAVDAIAREGLGSDSFRTRAAAVKALAELGDAFVDDIIRQLADLYPQVRVAAIAGLERLRPDGAWRSQLRYECYVPAGEFIMGEDKEAMARPALGTLNAFYIGKYPVTNAEYARFMADRGRGFDMPAGKENHPVVNVSWYDAKDYADWASMRLLTEAEWEKAASWEEVDKEIRKHRGTGHPAFGQQVAGGRKRKYPWGDTFDEAKCNTSESGIGTTTPVGKYSPAGDSPCGAADMAGNVWEWRSSQYKDYPYDADDGRENLTDYARRVLRGGSFYDGASVCAAHARVRALP